MRETGDVLYESGHVVDVTVVTLGDELDGDHADGATTLTVGDCVDFDAGCVILIDGVTYDVISVDDDANTLTISPGLFDAKDDGETVELWDPLYQAVSSYKSVQVRVLSEDSNEDVVDAALASHLVDKLDEGIRGARGESVLLEMDGDEWRVIDVLGFGEPDTLGSVVLFYQDHHPITDVGDQEITLTFLPIQHSEHVYWNGVYQRGVNWSRSGQVVTMADADEWMQAGDVVTVEYAYRVGFNAPDVPGDPPDTLGPLGTPTLYDGLGTGGASNVGTGDIWIDADSGTYTVINAVDNSAGRDTATIQLPSNTTLSEDPTNLTVWCDLTVEGNFQTLDISLRTSGAETAPGILMTGAYIGPGGAVSVELTGDEASFLERMANDDEVWLRVYLDASVAPVGLESATIRESCIRLEWVES